MWREDHLSYRSFETPVYRKVELGQIGKLDLWLPRDLTIYIWDW
jgi:hypothetical protein